MAAYVTEKARASSDTQHNTQRDAQLAQMKPGTGRGRAGLKQALRGESVHDNNDL